MVGDENHYFVAKYRPDIIIVLELIGNRVVKYCSKYINSL
jgi:hypothetical protein